MIKNEIYKYFAGLVFEKSGIYYPEKDFYRLDSRINAMIAQFNCKDADDLYLKFSTQKTAEMETFLMDIFTNNETYFFRDTKPFDALTNHITPEILEGKPLKQLNIWSCASSTGQEPLSIVMSLTEKFGAVNNEDLFLKLDATDISSKALAKAQAGVYTGLDVQRGLPIQMLVKYFENTPESEWKIKPEFHSVINYYSFNLFSELYPINKYDIIFCRNVLIYQNSENKAQILEKLVGSLVPGGYLIMGAGESLIGVNVDLVQKSVGNCMVFQKPDPKKEVA